MSGFRAASDSLLERFEDWLRGDRQVPDGEAAEVASDVFVALDWKWNYAGGDLLRWRTADVAEFLLEWCPAKLSASPAESLPIPAALTAFLAFLGATGRLSPGSSPLESLVEAAVALTEEFEAAMGDASRFGLAKSLFAAAAADGVDLGDPDELEEWIAEFNARPEEDRRRVIPDTVLALPRRPALPPVAVPDDSAVAASKAAAPILAMFAAFAGFVGNGRKLTQTGNLTLADARALVELVGTGDVMDGAIGERTFKTRTSADLPRLRQVFAWARKAGVVRVARGRVIATKRGLAIGRDPAAFFDKAVDALLAIGPLSSQRYPDAWLAWPEVDRLLDRYTMHLLVGPYVAQRAVAIDDLAAVLSQAVLDVFEFRSLADGQVERRIGIDVVDIVDVLELAGVVRRRDMAEADDAWPTRRRGGGTVELTAAGVATTRRLLADAGYETPAAGHFAASTATELFLATDLDDLPVLRAEIDAWQARRTPAEAAAELAEAVRDLQDPARRNLALAVLGEMDREFAGPVVRRLATEPATRGFAMCWLVDHGFEESSALFDADDVEWFVDVLAHRLVTRGPDGLSHTLGLAGSHENQIRVIEALWRSPSTATDAVLAAIGEIHPAKVVAKAARKARFKRRSWLGA